MKKIINVVVTLLLLAVGLAYAQAQRTRKRAVRFTSVYTNLKTQCRSALTPKEEKESEAVGEDIPSVCKGYGGYEIFLASHGAIEQLQVYVKSAKEEDEDVVVAETMSISDPVGTRKVEWRLADGKPFAIIFRRDANEDQPEDPSVRKKGIEVLRVIGLKDKRIDFWVDPKKTANPNAEARRLADQAYSK